jgi:hypothetical protein
VADRMGRELCQWGGADRWHGLLQPQGLTSSEEDQEKAVADEAREGEVMVWAWVGKKQ